MNITWDVTTVRSDGSSDRDKVRLQELLNDGWFPFAAVGDISGHLLFLRRQKVVELHPEGT